MGSGYPSIGGRDSRMAKGRAQPASTTEDLGGIPYQIPQRDILNL